MLGAVGVCVAGTSKQAGGIAAALGAAWFWFSQATSIVGLIGIVEDLKLWVDTAAWLIAQARALAPGFADALVAIGAALHAALELFRGVFRPLFDFLLGWLPFDVPQIAKDAAVVAVFALLGHWRMRRKHFRDWRAVSQAEFLAMRARALEAGLNVPEDQYKALNFERGFQAYWRLHGVPFEITDEKLRAMFTEDLNAAIDAYGPGFESFVATQRETAEIVSPAQQRVFRNESTSLMFVWTLAIITIVLVAIDVFLVR